MVQIDPEVQIARMKESKTHKKEFKKMYPEFRSVNSSLLGGKLRKGPRPVNPLSTDRFDWKRAVLIVLIVQQRIIPHKLWSGEEAINQIATSSPLLSLREPTYFRA